MFVLEHNFSAEIIRNRVYKYLVQIWSTYGFQVDIESSQELYSVWDEVGILDVVQVMFTGIGGIISAIFISIFVFGEYGNGAIKNIAGKGYDRRKIFSTKYIFTILTTVIMLIIMTLFVALMELVFVGTERFTTETINNFVHYTFIQLLLATALSGVVIMINQFCRNLGAGIAISICLFMFSSFITGGLDILFRYFKVNIKTSDYWLVDLISTCPKQDMDSAFVTRAIISAIVWIIVAFIIGNVHFQKTDIK